MVYVAKPYMQNNKDMREFDTKKQAATYLLLITGYTMSVQDWEMVGKIFEKETEDGKVEKQA
jgi:hypothetical protein